ncbi:MAG: hypothetical protein LBJ95_02560 [Oscillospiraceae bacterium]|nr:hypothetical protein [Oscillospiraceae bacterium]
MTLLETLEPWCRRYGDRTPLGCDREITVDKINRIVTTSWNVANCPIKDEIYVEFHPRGKRGQFTYLDTPAPITVPVWRVRANAELGW